MCDACDEGGGRNDSTQHGQGVLKTHDDGHQQWKFRLKELSRRVFVASRGRAFTRGSTADPCRLWQV